ncbi:MAG: hypothetical protein KJO61_10400 [Deltaproteobacteria bacterium]|nr:hypothetical protein [Deltaproteobacteria bacterium]
MDKKVVIFFSVFALILISGSLVLSLWLLPKYALTDSPYDMSVSNSRIDKLQAPETVTTTVYGPRNETGTNQRFRSTQIIIVFGAIYIVFLFGTLLKKRYIPDKPASNQTYLYKMSRLTGKSEYDIFFKAAEDWPVSGEQIEQDFNMYLAHQHIPYYVNDFIRKNKKHIDESRMSFFVESWYGDN